MTSPFTPGMAQGAGTVPASSCTPPLAGRCGTPAILSLIADQLAANHPMRVRPEVFPETSLADLRVDAIDRLTIALALEDAFGIVVTDEAMHAWTCAADIVATAERMVP